MSFVSISVKEAMENINATSNGWFLPAVQRPFVWGSRYESEKYICKLFDSILRGYPIGTLILWNSDKEVPYRQFIDDYIEGETASFVDKNMWKREDKWLVYDGQQRLQTLFSCLKYTLNNRILTFNLFFDINETDDAEANGFEFIEKNTSPKEGYIVMPFLFLQPDDGKVKFRNEIKASLNKKTIEGKEEPFEMIIDRLWDVFVRKDIKSLAYFPIEKTWNEDRVNDVFQRLNTGGVPLSGADLLLSKIKEKCYDYEEKLQLESKQIEALTQGYIFPPNTLLQIIHFLVKDTIRIDPDKVKESELEKYINCLPDLFISLEGFFKFFLSEIFNINNISIIPRPGALFPLILFSYGSHKKGIPFRNINTENLKLMKQYFILSQVNDWNTQTIIQNSSSLALKSNELFPLDNIKDFVEKNNRLIDLSIEGIENYIWFMLKILIPHRSYITSSNITGRYKPEIDHIFPIKLKNAPKDYNVDIIWNMQPVTGVINASKRNIHPKDFFGKPENAEVIDQYDYVPKDLDNPLWDNHKLFIESRKSSMLKFLQNEYGIIV